MSVLRNVVTASVFMSCFFSVHTCLAQESARDIMVKVDERPDGDDCTMKMTMTLINRRGHERVRQMVVYSKDYGKDSKSLFYFEKPADVKGTGFLSWEYDDPDKDDDRWLYLPALKRSRRISGASKKDAFMGSDLSYDDMGDRSVDEDKHVLLKEEVFGGKRCWVIESTPKNDDCQYSKMVRWIRKDISIVLKGVFYDKKGALLKIMKQSEIGKQDDYWVVNRIDVENVQEKHKTVLEISERVFDSGLDDGLFRVATLERGKHR